MELNIGNYIRTKNGKIRKVINDKFYMEIYIETDKGIVDRSHIVKHSPNIIDLIEVGDYVNGKEVLRINDYGNFKRADFNLDYDDCDAVYNEDIKTIVTKEIMKNVMYEV